MSDLFKTHDHNHNKDRLKSLIDVSIRCTPLLEIVWNACRKVCIHFFNYFIKIWICYPFNVRNHEVFFIMWVFQNGNSMGITLLNLSQGTELRVWREKGWENKDLEIYPPIFLYAFDTWPVWLYGWGLVYEVSGYGFKSRCCHLKTAYFNPINFRAPFISAQHECVKINNARSRSFFVNLGGRKLMVCKFLKYHFIPEFDGILQYFSPP